MYATLSKRQLFEMTTIFKNANLPHIIVGTSSNGLQEGHWHSHHGMNHG